MANTKSAQKAIRVIDRRSNVNKQRKDAFKDARKDVKKALAKGDKSKAEELLTVAYKKIDKAAKNKVIHKKAAARYKSRLAKQVNAK